MYQHILITLDGSNTDRAIIDHIKALAPLHHSRVSLLHVINNAQAVYHGKNAAGEEVEATNRYLEGVRLEFEGLGLQAQTHIAFGEPVKEIVSWVHRHACNLVAMGTHGHGFMADIVLGTTAIKVQHSISVPVLLLRAR